MKLDDIDRDRYSTAMFALGMAYAMLRKAQRGEPIDNESMAEFDRLVERIYKLNAQASLLEGKPKP